MKCQRAEKVVLAWRPTFRASNGVTHAIDSVLVPR